MRGRRSCAACGRDVSQAKRTKVPSGDYYCERCYLARSSGDTSAPPTPPLPPVRAATNQRRHGDIKQTVAGLCETQRAAHNDPGPRMHCLRSVPAFPVQPGHVAVCVVKAHQFLDAGNRIECGIDRLARGKTIGTGGRDMNQRAHRWMHARKFSAGRSGRGRAGA